MVINFPCAGIARANTGCRDVSRRAERAPFGPALFDRLAVGEITAANSPDGARNEPAAAADTAGDYLRKPAAAVSGQIIWDGDAPRETGRFGGVASCPDAEFQAKASEDNGATGEATMRPADSMTGEVSRVDAGQTASATSEHGRDGSERRAPYSPWQVHRPHLEPMARRASV
jgi:hypothetical protein